MRSAAVWLEGVAGRGPRRSARGLRGEVAGIDVGPVSGRFGGSGGSSFRLVGLLPIAVAALFAIFSAAASAAPPTQFGTEGEGAGQFSGPVGIAVEQQSGDVYIADRDNNRVDKFGFLAYFLRAFLPGLRTGAAA